MPDKNVLDELMMTLLKDPYCRRTLRDILDLKQESKPDPLLLAKAWTRSEDVGPEVRDAYLDLLNQYNGNVTRLIRELGRSRAAVYKILDQLGIGKETLDQYRNS
ncbi:hypothetical protein KY328_00220 [Candidatus Woesearchaeota archaeon]|nr:hypothetical protein [Candidatus Woesearchaeota archaeon]MBW3021322.1 hypothetical protein [Candidatus Woesearchaeota archaeon]